MGVFLRECKPATVDDVIELPDQYNEAGVVGEYLLQFMTRP